MPRKDIIQTSDNGLNYVFRLMIGTSILGIDCFYIFILHVDFEFIVNVVLARGLDNDVSFVMFYDSPLFSLNDNIQAVSLVFEPNFLTNELKLNYY